MVALLRENSEWDKLEEDSPVEDQCDINDYVDLLNN